MSYDAVAQRTAGLLFHHVTDEGDDADHGAVEEEHGAGEGGGGPGVGGPARGERVHAVVGAGGLACGIVQGAEEALLGEVVTIQEPEHGAGEVADVDEGAVGVFGGESKEGRDEGDGPAADEEGIAGHAGDDGLDEVEVLALVVVHEDGVVRVGGLEFHGPVLNMQGVETGRAQAGTRRGKPETGTS